MRDVKEPEVRRTEIMEAALLLFIEKGYMNTTTQDIIDKVKISRGLLYYHFKNKEDILYCLVERYSDPLLGKLAAITYHTQKNAIQKLNAFMEATLTSTEQVTQEATTLQKTVSLEQNRYLLDQFSHNFTIKVTEYFSSIIEQGISEHVFDIENPKETATFLMTGYVFVSNEVKAVKTTIEKQYAYISAFKKLLARTLGINLTVLIY